MFKNTAIQSNVMLYRALQYKLFAVSYFRPVSETVKTENKKQKKLVY